MIKSNQLYVSPGWDCFFTVVVTHSHSYSLKWYIYGKINQCNRTACTKVNINTEQPTYIFELSYLSVSYCRLEMIHEFDAILDLRTSNSWSACLDVSYDQ